MGEDTHLLKRLVPVLLCCLWFLGGCGGSGPTPVEPSASQELPSAIRVGRLFLTRGIGQAQVEFFGPDGNKLELGPITTNAAGIFFVKTALPIPFRVTATTAGPGGTPETYAAVYEALPRRGMLEINAVTTLVDSYHRRHSELSLDEASSRVRRLYGIPENRDLGHGTYSLRLSHFNHANFLRKARANPGGLPAYLDKLVGIIDASSSQNLVDLGPDGPGIPNLNAISETDEDGDLEPLPADPPACANFNTIEPGNYSEAEYDLVENNEVNEVSTSVTGEAVSEAVETSAGSVVGNVVKSVGEMALRSLGQFVLNLAIQQVFAQFGITQNQNAVILKQLQALQSQVTALQNSVNNLQNAVFQGFLQSDYATQTGNLSNSVAVIQGLWGNSTAGEESGYSGALALASVADLSPTGTLLKDFQNQASYQTLKQALIVIQNNQLGINGAPTSLIILLRKLATQERYLGVFLSEQLYGQFNFYQSLQIQANTMMVALDRSQVPPDLITTRSDLKTCHDSLRAQFALMPFPLDEHIIYDRRSQLLVYNQVFPSTTLENALAQANTFAEGTLTQHWAIASVTDLQNLTKDNVNQGTPESILQSLGLDTSAADANGSSILTVEPQGITYYGYPPAEGTVTFNNTNLTNLASQQAGTDPATLTGPYILVSYAYAQLSPESVDGMDEPTYLGLFGMSGTGYSENLTVNISPDGSQCTATTQDLFGGVFDITKNVVWESSAPGVAEISNAPGSEGLVRRLGGAPAGTVTFTASRIEANAPLRSDVQSILGQQPPFDGTFSSTNAFTYGQAPPATLTSIFLSPIFTTVAGAPPQQQRIYVVGQFSDGSAEELTADPMLGAQLTFTSSDPKVTVDQPSSAGKAMAGPVFIKCLTTVPAGPTTIGVSIQGLTDQTTINFTL